VQITAIFSHALWPEFSRLCGANANVAIRQLFYRSSYLGAVQAFVLSGILYFTSPFLLRIWTHNSIAFVPNLMCLMLMYATVAGIWHVPRVLLMATNQHMGLAYWALITSLLTIGLTWGLSGIFLLNGVVIAMLLSELFIAIICAYLAYQAISQNHLRMPVTQ
jgi:O-antigen/teichoic acid export membrane protein